MSKDYDYDNDNLPWYPSSVENVKYSREPNRFEKFFGTSKEYTKEDATRDAELSMNRHRWCIKKGGYELNLTNTVAKGVYLFDKYQMAENGKLYFKSNGSKEFIGNFNDLNEAHDFVFKELIDLYLEKELKSENLTQLIYRILSMNSTALKQVLEKLGVEFDELEIEHLTAKIKRETSEKIENIFSRSYRPKEDLLDKLRKMRISIPREAKDRYRSRSFEQVNLF